MKTKNWARPHPSYRIYGLLVLCMTLFLNIEAQANNIPYTLYRISDGLPHENIQTIEQTPDGRLWVGTSAGLSFYTGSGFTPVRFLDASSTADILEIEPLGNDDIWVATNELGVWQVRYQHAVQAFPALAHVRASRLIARNDTMYVFGQQKIWKVSLLDETISSKPYRIASANFNGNPTDVAHTQIVSADIDNKGNHWVLDQKRGPGRLMPDGTIYFIDHDVADEFGEDGWYALRFDEQGTAWATHEKAGLFKFSTDEGNLELVIKEVGVRHICVTPAMIVVTSYNHGALYWSLKMNKVMPPMNEASGLPTSRVNCIYRDHEGNAWIGTQIGLIHISHPGVKHLMSVGERPLLNLNAVYNDQDKSLWASSFSEGLFQLYPERKSVLPAGENRWSDLFEGQDNRLYALGGSGWFAYDGNGAWDQVQSYAGGYHGDVDRFGTGYFWHRDGLYEHKQHELATPVFMWPVEEQDFHYQTLSKDGDLIVWANGQLLQLPVSNKSRRTKSEGSHAVKLIRNVSAFSNIAVKDVEADYLGRTWVALLGNGLLCVDQDTAMQFLPGHHIEKLSVEGDSLLVANTREGLFVFNLPEKGKPFLKKQSFVPPSVATPHLRADEAVRYHLTQSDGLMSSTVSGSAFTKDFLWVAHPGGISQIPRRLLTREAPTPQVLLTSINYNGIARSPYRDLELKASDRNIGFEFSATTYSHPHLVQYRYRLKGLDKRWSATEKPFVHFAKLPAGEYEFEVQAATSDTEYGETISYDFMIPEPYYQLPAFWMGIMVLLTVLFYYLHLYRLRSMLQVERTRTQIAMDLHDDIGSSLTSLSFMSNLAYQRTEDQTPKEEISPLLKEIGSMSSELVDNMLDIVWSVDPKQDSVGSVISRLQAFYQRVHSASEISVHWKVEEGVKKIALPPRSRRNLYLILKEAVNNAIKHSGASKIDVAMTQDLIMLHIVVQDYGQGFDAEKVKSGYGLSTMRERAEESGASFELRSSEGSATTVYIRWPLRKHAS